MTLIEIERWALHVLTEVKEGRPYEDSRVELKSAFPTDPKKAARQIAAHANAARGSPILWIIGVDPKRGILGLAPAELSSWFPSVRAAFAGVCPEPRDLVVHPEGPSVQVIYFETDRAPYLVNNPNGGNEGIQREVPWRDTTGTRTATREELLMILQPSAPAPEIELLSAKIEPTKLSTRADGALMTHCTMEVYVVPFGTNRVVFPSHRCSGKLISEGAVIAEGLKIRFHKHNPIDVHGLMETIRNHQSNKPVVNVSSGFEPVEIDPDHIIINRPAKIQIIGDCAILKETLLNLVKPTLIISLGLAEGGTKPCFLEAHLTTRSVSQDNMHTWYWRQTAKS